MFSHVQFAPILCFSTSFIVVDFFIAGVIIIIGAVIYATEKGPVHGYSLHAGFGITVAGGRACHYRGRVHGDKSNR